MSDISQILFIIFIFLNEVIIIRTGSLKNTKMLLQWLTIMHEDIVLSWLVWKARRQLKKLGKDAWADSIRIGVDEQDWNK